MNSTQAATTIKAPLSGIAEQAVPETSGQTVNQVAGQVGDALTGAVSSLGQTDALFTWGGYFQALALLFLIVAVLFAALWFLKRKGGLSVLTRQGDLVFESKMALGPKKSLVVVRFLNKRVLLGVTDQQITMLTELPTDEDDTAYTGPAVENPADFKNHLARATQGDPKNST